MTKKKNQTSKKKKGLNPVAIGAAGAAVGAGVAVAANAALSNKKTRKQIGKVVDTVKDQTSQIVGNLQTQENIEKGKKVVRDTVKSARKNLKNGGKSKSRSGKSTASKSRTASA